MTTKVKPIPDGYHSVTPYLIVKNATQALDFYQKAFGAEKVMCMADDKGKICHAEFQIGDSKMMLADEFPERGAFAPQGDKGPISIHLYVADVDTIFKRALAAGAKETRPIANQFYGDRSGGIVDPYGHHWYISTHIEDISEEELNKRMQAMMQQ